MVQLAQVGQQPEHHLVLAHAAIAALVYEEVHGLDKLEAFLGQQHLLPLLQGGRVALDGAARDDRRHEDVRAQEGLGGALFDVYIPIADSLRAVRWVQRAGGRGVPRRSGR